MSSPSPERIRKAVRDAYGNIARKGQSTLSGGNASCCGSGATTPTERMTGLGYDAIDASVTPDGAELGLGCGNPHGVAGLTPGETVLDLGSGAGIDCFLAARKVGASGRVIGVDMTPEMISRARAIAIESDVQNVEFRLGEIEHIPVDDRSIDVVLSNCVINLSPDKPQVYREIFRVLRSGGRLAIADIVASTHLPDSIRNDMSLHACCVAGAASIADLEGMLAGAGFREIAIRPIESSRMSLREWDPDADPGDHIVSAIIEARRP